MHSYFGSGYLWNLVRRGASPPANSRQLITPVPARAEPTFAITDNEAPGIETIETSAVTLPLASYEASNLPPETTATEIAVARATPSEQHGTLAPDPSAKSDAPLLSPSPEPMVSPITRPADNLEASPAKEQRRGARPANDVFELKMPDNFFGPADKASIPIQAETEPPVQPVASLSVPVVARVKNEPAPDLVSVSEPARPVQVHSEDLSPPNPSRISPERLSEPKPRVPSESPAEPQTTIQLGRPPQIAQPPPMPSAGSVTARVVDSVDQGQQPAARPPAPALEEIAPRPGLEQTSEHLRLRPPPTPQAVVAPPARLRIDRLDIQIINTVPTPQPAQTPAPDVSQLLDRKHLGRLDLLL